MTPHQISLCAVYLLKPTIDLGIIRLGPWAQVAGSNPACGTFSACELSPTCGTRGWIGLAQRLLLGNVHLFVRNL